MPAQLTDLQGVTADSRQVRPGYLFAALPGSKGDGRDYISDAIRHGASVILAPEGTALPEKSDVELITDENVRRRFAMIASEYYAAQPATVAAVTGTNGKTSVAWFTEQIWRVLGYTSASLGTIGVHTASGFGEGSLTTPDPAKLHASLADLAGAGITHLAMEASSHGLDQYRLDGVTLKAAAFTNLTLDHLDYHKTMENYFLAKARLFSEVLPADGTAVLNHDSCYFQRLEAMCRERGVKILEFGPEAKDINLSELTPDPQGLKLSVTLHAQTYDFTLPLIGRFQAENALAALGLVLASDEGIDPAAAIKALKTLQGTPGRLQSVPGHPKCAAVYIDYAHTPDAMENVLKALRPHTSGRLICLFGCGGDRNKEKRPLMGKAVAEHADIAILTDDNPRSEDPAAIRADVLTIGEEITEIGDRREAIMHAIRLAGEGDVVAITGKGHETGQTIAGVTHPFDDAEEAAKAIAAL